MSTENKSGADNKAAIEVRHVAEGIFKKALEQIIKCPPDASAQMRTIAREALSEYNSLISKYNQQ